VFYVISLLHLPKLYTANFFVRGVKAVAETRVCARRINDFLLQPEASTPTDAEGAWLSASAGRWQHSTLTRAQVQSRCRLAPL